MDTTTSSQSSSALILGYLLDYVAVCSMQKKNTTTALLQVKFQVELQAPVKWFCYLWLLGNVHHACVGGGEKCGCAIYTNLRKPCNRPGFNAFPQEWLGLEGTVGFSEGVCGLCATQSAEPACQAA